MSVTTTVTAQGGAASFAALFEESLKSNDMRVGEVISAEVVRIEFNHVVVNAGLKSESYVAIEEFKNDQGELEVQVGDFVSVAIDAVENGYGDTILSRDKAKRLASWMSLENSLESGEFVTGTVSGKVKGGLTVLVNGIRAFLPGSLLDVYKRQVLAATQGGCFELSGVPRMHERPIGDLVDALRPLGCTVDALGQPGYPPLRLRGEAGARLATHQPIRVRGDVSSQFLTALLLALPLVSQDHAIVVEVQGELISRPYIDITLNLLARFGIRVQRDSWQRFTIAQGSAYRTPGQVHVEGDASSASYFVALGALAATAGNTLRIEGVGSDSIQGDIRFIEAAVAMGAEVRSGPGWLEVQRGRWPLAGITLDCNHIPDAAMTLAVMALFADSPTRLSGIASWRVKETDRIAAMATELRKVGAQVVEGPDFIQIHPPLRWASAVVHTYDDHRMAMCLSLAAFNPLAGAHCPQRILDPRCVTKTFPDYFETLFSVAQAAPQAIPVITIDGPTASGKGTLAAAVAQALGYHLLDSGALYRLSLIHI